MVSASLLLLCAAAASAVPLKATVSTTSPSTPSPSPSGPVIDIDSKLASAVVTGGGAQVTTSGGTSGAASVTSTVRGPGSVSTLTAVGQGGISGSSATAGNSASLQKGRSKTVVEATTEGTQVKTGTQGKGITSGEAVANQKAGAEGGAQRVEAVKYVESDGKNLYKVEKVDRTAVKSASGHEASSRRFGTFNVLNLGSTAINNPGLIALPAQAPSSEPEPEPTPVYWNPKNPQPEPEPQPEPHPEPEPEPEPHPKPTKPVAPQPKKELSSESKAKQAGKTTGLGAVSSTGATQGAAQSQTSVETPNGSAKQAAVVNSGVGLTGVSSGTGLFNQKAHGKTAVTRTGEGIDVTSISSGLGETDGAAGSIQSVATNGGFTAVDTLNLKLPGLDLGSKAKASGTSSSGHKASSSGPGRFITSNEVGTEIKLTTPELDLETIHVPLPAPTTKPPKVKRGKW
nr:CP19k-like protein 1 [Amphibalanus amphitrite]